MKKETEHNKISLSELQGDSNKTNQQASVVRRVAFVFHDAYSGPEDHWYRWLEEELKKLDYEVFIPKFPTPEGQTLQYWLKVFENYRDNLNIETIFIGHGIGCAFALRVLEQLEKPIRDCFFVSPYIDPLGHAGFDRISKTFLEGSVDWLAVNRNIRTLSLFYSDNDPFVSQKKSRAIHDYVRSELHLITEGGHFDHAQGYGPFPELFSSIEKWHLFKKESSLSMLSEDLKKKNIDQDDLKQNLTSASLGLTTFYQDLGKALDNSNAKEMSALLQKERRREIQTKTNKRNSFKNKAMAFFAVVAVLGGFWWIVTFRIETGQIQKEISYVGIVTSEYKAEVDLFGMSLSDLKTRLPAALDIDSSPGQVVWISFKDSSKLLDTVRSRDFFDFLGVNNGQVFRQDTEGSFQFGYYQDEEKTPFIIFETKSLRRTLQAMKNWSPEIYTDLIPLFGLREDIVVSETFTEITKANNKYWQLFGRKITAKDISRETSEEQEISSIFSVESSQEKIPTDQQEAIDVQSYDIPVLLFAPLSDNLILVAVDPELLIILFNKMLDQKI